MLFLHSSSISSLSIIFVNTSVKHSTPKAFHASTGMLSEPTAFPHFLSCNAFSTTSPVIYFTCVSPLACTLLCILSFIFLSRRPLSAFGLPCLSPVLLGSHPETLFGLSASPSLLFFSENPFLPGWSHPICGAYALMMFTVVLFTSSFSHITVSISFSSGLSSMPNLFV